MGTATYLLMPKICIDGSNTGEFGDDVAEIDKETGDHDEEGGAETEFFTDEIGEAFAGDDAHAGAHFHGDVEGDGHGNEGPEKGVAVGGSGLRVGGDTAGVVVDVGGDDAGADDGEEQEDAVTPLIAAGEKAEDAGAEAVDGGVNGGEGHEEIRELVVRSSGFRRGVRRAKLRANGVPGEKTRGAKWDPSLPGLRWG